MKLIVSNLCWNINENNLIINLLNIFNINNIEISPYKIFNNNYSLGNINKTQNFWKKKKVNFYSMQSILFNIKNAYLFGNKSEQKVFFTEIKKKIILCKKIGIKVIVFGSPHSKKIFSNKNLENLNLIAFKSFKKIAQICEKYKIYFCVEANPKIYNCEYLNYTKDVIILIKKINSNFFKLNLDLGTIIENKENFSSIIHNYIKLIGHVQISVPHLKDIMSYKSIVCKFIRQLKKKNYKRCVSIERLPVDDNVISLKKTLKLTQKFF